MSEPSNPIRAKSEMLRQIIREKVGVDFDYSLFSLLYLDQVLAQLFGQGMARLPKDGMEDFKNALTVQLGCFYGECLRETFSGEWHNDEKLGLCLRKLGNKEVTVFPLSTARDRIQGEDGKIFAATNFVCREVFKQVHETTYASNDASISTE